MKKSKLFKGILTSGIIALFVATGLASTASATVSNIAEYGISRYNTAGTATKEMTDAETTFCFLTKVGIEETDSSGEMATCRVVKGTYAWYLEATLEASSDADVSCAARCFNR